MTTMAGTKGRLGQSLVALQVTLSLVLLSGATLFVRTLQNLETVGSGFSARNVVALTVDTQLPRPPRIAKPTPADIAAYLTPLGQAWTALNDRIATSPGVESSAIATMVPLTGRDRGTLMAISGGAPMAAEERYTHVNYVTPGYFATLRIPLRVGRYFTVSDRAGAARVAILNQTAARAYFGDGNPIGRSVSFPGQPVEDEYEIVGVVGDVRYESARIEDARMAYLPIEQSVDPVRSALLLARATKVDEAQLRDAVAKGITGGFAPRLESLGEMARASLTRERLLSMLASFFGILALLLACIGLYGIMAYGVMRRTREIGIRLAVGASRRSVLWMMLRETLIVVTIGVIAGAIASVPATRALRNQLFGVAPADPASLTIAIVILVAIAAIAGYVPARRATRINPLSALRCE
jgi:predicted permease